MTAPITGDTLLGWGFRPGREFGDLLVTGNRMRAGGADDAVIRAALELIQPPKAPELSLRTNSLPFGIFLDAETEDERENRDAVIRHMDALLRVPTLEAGALMPDACPSGAAMGTIPVGGAVAARDAIHPGFHSADICCSVAITVFARQHDPRAILDAVQETTHFGPGGRARMVPPPDPVMAEVKANRFLRGLESMALGHFASQGDGNHFAYVGHLRSTGRPALVTHHGSRGLGAQLYKRGLAAAQRHTAVHAPRVPAHNAWLVASSPEGQAYWSALQTVRAWTRESHFALHDMVARRIGVGVEDRFWNEHNFVFRREDGLYYHGKGATPSWAGFSADDDGRTLIPLNMAEPILIAAHRDRRDALGFAPHGAGRNMSRSRFLKEGRPEMPKGLDVRFYCGKPDLSELPQAYKSASAVRAQIARYGLAEVVDEVVPYGCIMAGDRDADAPWRRKKAAKAAKAARKGAG